MEAFFFIARTKPTGRGYRGHFSGIERLASCSHAGSFELSFDL